MFTKNIKFKNFIRKKNPKTNKILRNIIKDKALLEKYPLLNSLTKKFQYSYKKKNIKSFKSYSKVNLIGMGGSIIGAESIYNFRTRHASVMAYAQQVGRPLPCVL